MTSLTFYGGVDEIGGNKILLEDKDTRILLDFGMSFKQSGKCFSEFLQPRKCNCIIDFQVTGLLPKLEGTYRQDYLDYLGYPKEERSIDAVLISHAHMDHSAYIHHLRKDIPIHMSQPTHAIMKTLEETGSGTFQDLLHHTATFQIRPKKRGAGYTKIKGEDAKTRRPLKVFEYGKKYSIGSLEVIPYEVDHSLPGATAYLIHTSEGTILYTGDFRFHGYKAEATERMVEAAAEEDLVALIIEGTRVDEQAGNTETDVLKTAGKFISTVPGLVAVNFPARDLARLKTFHRIAQNTDRKLVLSFKHAYLLEQFSALGSGEYPPIDDPHLCFYADRKGWGLAGRDDYPLNIVEQDYDKWEREYLHMENTINYQDIRENQEQFLFYCNYFQLNELVDITPKPGSRYVRSVCEPFSDEMLFDERRVKNWLDLYGFGEAYQIHASGHASGPEVMGMIKRLDPHSIYPIHTESATLFAEQFNQVKPVKKGVRYDL